MKVLILGCGYTGQRLAHLLQAEGIPAHLTTRNGTAPTGLDLPCFAFDWDSADPSRQIPLDPDALQGVTHVLTTIPPDSWGLDPIVSALIAKLEPLPLQWFGYLSTTGVYGNTQGAWVDETAAVHPENPRSQHRVNAESTFLNSQLPAHIFRLPGIYGPGQSMFDRLRSGKAQRIDYPGQVFSRIHVGDIVQTLWRSLNQPTPGEIYNISDDEPSESNDLVLEACRLLGMEPPPLIPYAEIGQTLSPMAASFWSECRRVANHKIKEKLGVKLLYPTYRQGLQAILQEEQSNR
jgi:nucleoside-diphosphate-sugar epimerase